MPKSLFIKSAKLEVLTMSSMTSLIVLHDIFMASPPVCNCLKPTCLSYSWHIHPARPMHITSKHILTIQCIHVMVRVDNKLIAVCWINRSHPYFQWPVICTSEHYLLPSTLLWSLAALTMAQAYTQAGTLVDIAVLVSMCRQLFCVTQQCSDCQLAIGCLKFKCWLSATEIDHW